MGSSLLKYAFGAHFIYTNHIEFQNGHILFADNNNNNPIELPPLFPTTNIIIIIIVVIPLSHHAHTYKPLQNETRQQL